MYIEILNINIEMLSTTTTTEKEKTSEHNIHGIVTAVLLIFFGYMSWLLEYNASIAIYTFFCGIFILLLELVCWFKQHTLKYILYILLSLRTFQYNTPCIGGGICLLITAFLNITVQIKQIIEIRRIKLLYMNSILELDLENIGVNNQTNLTNQTTTIAPIISENDSKSNPDIELEFNDKYNANEDNEEFVGISPIHSYNDNKVNNNS